MIGENPRHTQTAFTPLSDGAFTSSTSSKPHWSHSLAMLRLPGERLIQTHLPLSVNAI